MERHIIWYQLYIKGYKLDLFTPTKCDLLHHWTAPVTNQPSNAVQSTESHVILYDPLCSGNRGESSMV